MPERKQSMILSSKSYNSYQRALHRVVVLMKTGLRWELYVHISLGNTELNTPKPVSSLRNFSDFLYWAKCFVTLQEVCSKRDFPHVFDWMTIFFPKAPHLDNTACEWSKKTTSKVNKFFFRFTRKKDSISPQFPPPYLSVTWKRSREGLKG